jgi:long-subunit fatty acid transport protein
MFMLMVSSSIFAGGLLTNTNQHILFLRNPARGASTQIDALYSNPAGIAFMENGFHVSFNNQSAFQTRTIRSTFAPFKGFGGSEEKTFKGKASVPVIPSLFAVYKTDKWSFGGHFAISGGGGKATFKDGLGSFESQVAMIPSRLSVVTELPITNYSVESYLEGKQLIYGLQLGTAYQINDYLSAYAGVRVNYVNNGYMGYIRNIQANVGGGNMVNLNSFFTAAGNVALAGLTKDKELDCEQAGWGVTPVLGVDFKAGKWNVGLKYELNTHLNVKNKTKIDGTGLFTDGKKVSHDIPGLLSAGVSYEILPVLRASAGYHHFFDTHAKMAGKQKHIDQGTNEYQAGLEWDITKAVQVSAGLQRTEYGVGDNFQSDMSFSISSYSYGLGAGFNVTPKLKVNVAYFWTDYDSYTKKSNNYNGTGKPGEDILGEDIFTRTNKVFGVGVDYTF